MIKKIIAITVLLSISIFALTGCNNISGTIVTGAGPLETRQLDASDFSGINLSGAFNLTFAHSDTFFVEITQHENLFEYLETNVRGNVLHVGYRRGIGINTTGNAPRLTIHAPTLNSIDISGAVSGTIEVVGDRLDFDASGAGSITLVGEVNTLNIDSSGAISINAFDLIAEDVVVDVSGAASVDVHASSTLRVDLSGVGSVTYDGAPQVTQNVSGLGRVRSR